MTCRLELMHQGLPTPRTCPLCGLGGKCKIGLAEPRPLLPQELVQEPPADGICTCGTCGFQWKRGQHGGHSCTERLEARLKLVQDQLHNERKMSDIYKGMAHEWMAKHIASSRDANKGLRRLRRKLDKAADLIVVLKAEVARMESDVANMLRCFMKDHEIAALVNALRDIAIKYHGAQQLREQIAAVVVPALRGTRGSGSNTGNVSGWARVAAVFAEGQRAAAAAIAELQQSSSGITAGAENPPQVVDSGAAGPTRTGDLLITNQGAETAETLGNQQDTPTSAPAEGAKVAQGESSTCEGVTAGLRPPANRIRRALSDAAIGSLLRDIALAALDELERERDELRAKLAAYEQAPTVATVIDIGDECGENKNVAFFSHQLPPVGTELIARPTRKDGE